jgi:hypothetical protein
LRVYAALAAAWFLYPEVAYRPGGPLAQRLEQAFEMTPFYVGALVSAGVLAALSVLALILAGLPKTAVAFG